MLSVEKVFVTIQYCVNPATAGYTRGVVASGVDCRWFLTSNMPGCALPLATSPQGESPLPVANILNHPLATVANPCFSGFFFLPVLDEFWVILAQNSTFVETAAILYVLITGITRDFVQAYIY